MAWTLTIRPPGSCADLVIFPFSVNGPMESLQGAYCKFVFIFWKHSIIWLIYYIRLFSNWTLDRAEASPNIRETQYTQNKSLILDLLKSISMFYFFIRKAIITWDVPSLSSWSSCVSKLIQPFVASDNGRLSFPHQLRLARIYELCFRTLWSLGHCD